MNFFKFVPIYSGIAIASMVSLNTELSKTIGDIFSVLIIHAIGLLIMLAISIIKKQKVIYNKNIPLPLYLGGALGIFIVLFNNIVIKEIGVSLTLTLGIAGQIIASVSLEHIGFLGTKVNKFTLSKVPGLAFIILGSMLIFL